eukprot:1139060-Pelagomonas_calceolata.AAC.8
MLIHKQHTQLPFVLRSKELSTAVTVALQSGQHCFLTFVWHCRLWSKSDRSYFSPSTGEGEAHRVGLRRSPSAAVAVVDFRTTVPGAIAQVHQCTRVICTHISMNRRAWQACKPSNAMLA